jgi:hypothetical protein
MEGRLLLCAVCPAHAPTTPPSATDLAIADSPTAGASASVTPAATGDPLLPDMFPLVSQADDYVYGWTLDTGEIPGRILLRLTTAMANRGRGPMELNGGAILPNGSQEVYQRVYKEGGGWADHLAGTFTYHAQHEHIHFDNFASYSLREITPGNGVGDVRAAGEKISFCLLDVDHFDNSLAGSPPTMQYYECGQRQGVSVGWSDVYDQSLPDQWIDVTNVPDGRYWLEVQADPENRLLESDETNNVAQILIDLDKPSPDPMVVASEPTGQYPAAAGAVDFLFDQPMDAASFRVADDVVSFTGPTGADLRGQISGFSWPDNRTLRVSFNQQPATGAYSMTIGPNVLAADDGAAMDQDRDKTPGEVPQDRYTATFTVTNGVGPDAFGYEAHATAYEDVDLVRGAPGVFVVVDNEDDAGATIPLGTNTFNFYGTNYTGNNGLFANPNGIITLGSVNSAYGNGDLVTNPLQPTIAVLWDDWRTDQDARDCVLAQFQDTSGDGVPDRLVVEWNDIRRHSDPATVPAAYVTFQAILSLNTGGVPGAIVFNYRDIDTGSIYSNGGDASVGIKAGGDQTTAGNRLLVSRDRANHPFIASGKAIRVARPSGAVVGRYLFYNNSSFDGRIAAANAQDDGAVAPDKVPFDPGPGPGGTGRASFANVSSYSRGINGVMIDMASLFGKTPVASDFDVATGASLVGTWAAASAPAVAVRRGAGVGGSDRVTLVWPDNSVHDTWLRVTVKTTGTTNSAARDVFYFGHLAGETGDGAPAGGALVDVIDLAATRGAISPVPVPVISLYDYNRNGRVDALDVILTRSNHGATLPWLLGPAAPSSDGSVVVPEFKRQPTSRRTALGLDEQSSLLS